MTTLHRSVAGWGRALAVWVVVTALWMTPASVVSGQIGQRIYLSAVYRQTLAVVGMPLALISHARFPNVKVLSLRGGTMSALMPTLLISQDNGLAWQPVPSHPWVPIANPNGTAGFDLHTALVAVDQRPTLIAALTTADGQGLWVSPDLGLSWQVRTLPPDATCTDARFVKRLTTSPARGGRVIATVACDGDFGISGNRTYDLYVSDDAGLTWARLAPIKPGQAVSHLELFLSPFDPDFWLVAAADGWRETRDAGQTWTRISIPAASVTFSPNLPDTLYAWDATRVFVSQDRALTWRGLIDPACPQGGLSDHQLVALRGPTDTLVRNCHRGLRRSTDGGQTWSLIGEFGTEPAFFVGDHANANQFFHTWHNNSENTLVLRLTVDAGDHFQDVLVFRFPT